MRSFHKLAASLSILAVSACSSGGGSSVPGVSGSSSLVPGSAAARGQVQQSSFAGYAPETNVRQACPDTHQFGVAHCLALTRTDVAADLPSGFGPADLQAAYNLPSATKGAGHTVAIVDAFDDPNAESDLAVYRSTYGLTPCTTANGCFKKVNQRGVQGSYPQGDTGWGTEITLDIDMVSAGCPKCKILLVEADNNFGNALAASVDEAIALGANIVSNSYSGGGLPQQNYTHPGKIILASAGDDGYGIADPADFPSVVAVGGTSLVKGGSGRGWTESVWRGSGSGCSTFAKPAWQKNIGCSNRVANDVSAVANPQTGVAIYDTYGEGGWLREGGTSVSSPLLGAVYGLAGNATELTYGRSFWLKKNHKYLYDITVGSNGSCNPAILCNGEVGYDGPTGWGTPNGIGAF